MKYIIYCGPGIGDFVIMLPMARRIRLADKTAHITMLTRSDKNRIRANRELLKLQDYVDDIIYYNSKEIINDIGLILGVRKYDWGFKSAYTDSPCISRWPNVLLNIMCKKTAGVYLQTRPDLRYDVEVDFEGAESVYETPLRILNKIGISRQEQEPEKSLMNDELLSIIYQNLAKVSLSKRIISIVVGTANAPINVGGKKGAKPAKNWPYEYWEELSDLFVQNGFYVFLLGGAKERDEIEQLGLFKNSEVDNRCGMCTIIESLAIINESMLVVGADTGLMHCAAALGIPNLSLFGCTDYRQYSPYGISNYHIMSPKECAPCFGTDRLANCQEFKCMKEIAVDDVYRKAKEIVNSAI